MTLKEYLEDYASEETRANGEKIIAREFDNIGKDNVKDIVKERLEKIQNGERDFRF